MYHARQTPVTRLTLHKASLCGWAGTVEHAQLGPRVEDDGVSADGLPRAEEAADSGGAVNLGESQMRNALIDDLYAARSRRPAASSCPRVPRVLVSSCPRVLVSSPPYRVCSHVIRIRRGHSVQYSGPS